MTTAFQKIATVLGVLSVIALSDCGGSKTQQTSAPPATMSEAQREQNALPLSAAAPIPNTLRCKGEVVWVNMHTKAYHEPGDPYYGKTKNGQYMCQAAANAAGYRLAGSEHMHHKRSNMSGTPESPAPEST